VHHLPHLLIVIFGGDMTYPYGPGDPNQPVVPAVPASVTDPAATLQAAPVPGQPQGPAIPPAAAPPAPLPVSVLPTAYLPVATSAPPAAAPAADANRRKLTLVLAVLGAVLLVVSGVLGGLYINERGRLADTKVALQQQREIVTQREATIAESEKQVSDLTGELATTKTSLTSTTAERDVLLPCMRRTQELFDAIDNNRELTAIIRQTSDACKKAEDKVGS
jgi:cell division protein FtsB